MWSDYADMELDYEPNSEYPETKFFGEIYRGGIWERVTAPCSSKKEAMKALKKWCKENPRT